MKIIDIPQSGKCGLTVSYSGRNGQVRRQWVPGSNPNTGKQLVVRSILASLGPAWDALTEAQQDAWNAMAANYQTRSRLGQSGPLTGFQLYVKLNATLKTFGQEMIDAPVALPGFPALAVTGLVITNTGGTIAIKLTAPSSPGENTVIRAARPLNSGIRAEPQFTILGTCPAPVTGASDITALYTGEFGVPTVGTRLFVQAQQMTSGWLSQPQVFTALVPASA